MGLNFTHPSGRVIKYNSPEFIEGLVEKGRGSLEFIFLNACGSEGACQKIVNRWTSSRSGFLIPPVTVGWREKQLDDSYTFQVSKRIFENIALSNCGYEEAVKLVIKIYCKAESNLKPSHENGTEYIKRICPVIVKPKYRSYDLEVAKAISELHPLRKFNRNYMDKKRGKREGMHMNGQLRYVGRK